MNGERMEWTGVSVTACEETEGGGVHTLLEHVSFVLSPGDWVFVTGPNGSGKSTFARLLAGHRGAWSVQGRMERGFAGSEPIPYVLQHPDDSFVGMTPWEDVLSGLENEGLPAKETLRRTDAALTDVQLAGHAHARLEELSGGQKQLAAAASCLAAAPGLLILDEADAMLDPVSRESVYGMARRLWRQGTAVVWVSQQVDRLEHGDRVAAFLNGRLVYDGGVEGFLTEPAADGAGHTPSICVRLGYEPPYAAAVALELNRLGIPLLPLPLTPEALAEAVKCRA